MWRLFSLASLVVAAGVMLWPSQGVRHAGEKTPPAQACQCRIIDVIHYGGNVICQARRGSDIFGSGNNRLGWLRTEATEAEANRVVEQRRRDGNE